MEPTKVVFDINYPGDESAGIFPFTDRITIISQAGDFGGSLGEFEEFMQEALAEWYDGAKVVLSTHQ